MNDPIARVAGELSRAQRALDAHVSAPRLEAEVLLAAALNKDRSWIFGHPEDTVAEPETLAFRTLLERRLEGEPIAYITGEREFFSLSFRVTPDTLIPRPETEGLVEAALELLPDGPPARVLELGTGCGAVALALARHHPGAHITASDVHSATLAVARDNARRLNADNVGFLLSDWYAGVDRARFDLIVCNPPYVPEDDRHLRRGDCRFEPRLALAAGPEGLDALREIIAGAPGHLRDGGYLLLEHGHDQQAAVAELVARSGLRFRGNIRDLAGIPRISVGASE